MLFAAPHLDAIALADSRVAALMLHTPFPYPKTAGANLPLASAALAASALLAICDYQAIALPTEL